MKMINTSFFALLMSIALNSTANEYTNHCKKVSRFLYGGENNNIVTRGPLESLGISDLANITEDDKEKIERIFIDCFYDASVAKLPRSQMNPDSLNYRDNGIESFWENLMREADAARAIKPFYEHILIPRQKADSLLDGISSASLTEEQIELREELMERYEELNKECQEVVSKYGSNDCIGEAGMLKFVLVDKIDGRLRDYK